MSDQSRDPLAEQFRAVQRTPDSLGALRELAHGLQQMSRWQEAVAVNQKRIKLDANDWQSWSALGLCLARTGQTNRAIDAYRQALTIESKAGLHNDLGVVLMDAGKGEAAVAAFERAQKLEPQNTNTLNNLGIALRLVGRLPEARHAIERALSINSGEADSYVNLGNTLRDLGEHQAAIQALKKATTMQPNAADAFCFLAGAYLEAGEPRDALPALEGALRLDPVNRTALAYKAAALQEVSEHRAARALLDLEGLIDVRQFTEVPGVDSLQVLNAKLSAHVLAHPSLSFERTGNATRFGSHTSNLFEGDMGPAVYLQRMIDDSVSQYFAKRQLRPAHPFMAHRMGSWKTVAWAVVMRSQGHQIPHIHPSAWLSGVYYAKLPQVIAAESASREGWIEFGSPPEKLACKNQKLQKYFLPREGMMVLFPSYFYHQTVPFESEQERISIAFDVIPA